jgi:hypothetical protein
MYCPKCGQSQPSLEVRYCSRCGLPLHEISQWLETGDNALLAGMPSLPEEPGKRRTAMRQGAKLVFLSAVVFPFAFGLCMAVHGPFFLIFPATMFILGLAWALYARLFYEDAISPAHSKATHFGNRSELPPVREPSGLPWQTKPARTAEIAEPPSVTDRTTNLLERKK